MGARLRRKAAGAGLAAVGLGLGALLASPAGTVAASAPAEPAERPIVYAVVIDGLDGDDLDAGRAPFIGALINRDAASTYYYRESRAVMVAETNPNHASMMTGAYADRSGVPGNTYALYSDLLGEEDNEADTCETVGMRNARSLPTITSGEHPSCLRGESVFEAIKRQGNPDRLTTAGVFGKAKLGRMFSGRDRSGRRFADHLWAPCTPEDSPEEQEYCADVPIEPVNQDRTILDSLVMDEVLRTIREGVGPRSERPDFTFVNLPNVDNAGHVAGGGGLVYDAAIALADLEIRRLVDELRARGEWGRTILVILSDHSHDTTLLSTTLTRSLESAGIAEDGFVIVDNGNVDMLYLADRRAPDRHRLLARMREVILSTHGVDQALYRRPNPADGGRRHTLDRAEPGWRLAGPRTGDLVVTAEPGRRFSDPSALDNPLLGNHGGWHTRDNAFLISSGGDGVVDRNASGVVGERFSDTLQNPRQAENVDLASTVLGAFGLLDTRSNAGRYLGEALRERRLPGRARPSFRPALRAQALRARGGRRAYRLRWGPTGRGRLHRSGGEWTLQLRRRGGPWRTVLRGEPRQARRVRIPAGARVQARVAARTASGARTPWAGRRLG